MSEQDTDETVQVPTEPSFDLSDYPPNPHNPLQLERLWRNVLNGENTLASRSGGWMVRLEEDGENMPPADWNEIVVYDTSGFGVEEVGRWDLNEVLRD